MANKEIEEIRAKIPTDTPVSSDKETVEEVSLTGPIRLDYPESPSVQVKSVFYPFDGQWLPDVDPSLIGPRNFKTLQNTRYGDGGPEGIQGYTKINTTALTANYHNIRNGHQLRTEQTIKSYVLVHATHTTCKESNAANIYENRTAIPDQGDFQGSALHTDLEGNLEGRFSDAPGGQIAYANEKESCIWAGNEMPCAAFFTIYTPTIIGATDITFVDGGAGDDTITDGGSGFITAGFKVGHQIIVTGTSNNNSEFILTGVAAGTLTLETGVLTGEANTSAKITVADKPYHTKAKDYTERVNNVLQTEDQIVTIDGDTDGNKWIIFTTRPIQAFKYYIKTPNATGSATTTCKFWDGSKFVSLDDSDSDGTDDTNGSMKQTGTFSFTSTDGSARPLHFEGLYLYAYLFELSAGTAEIYQITVDAPFQDMVDVWDGVYRQPISLQIASGRTAAASGENSNGVITTLQSSSVPYGHAYSYIHEINVTDYGNLQIGTEITANAVVRTVTGKTSTTPVSFYPSWAGFGYGGDTTKIQLVNEGDNFQAAGFGPGDSVVVTGTPNNDGTYTLTYLLNGGMTAYFAGATFTEENVSNAVFSRVAHYYVDTNAAADWYNGGSGYSFTYKVPSDTAGTSDYKDYTLEVQEPSFADYPIGAVIDALDEFNTILVGFEERMSTILFGMVADLVNTNSVKMKIQWWDGEQYNTPAGISDSTYGLPGTEGVNKSFNRTGMLSWNPPEGKDEFKQTLFGKSLYYYEISVDDALTGTVGGAAEVVIDTIMGIPAQKVVNPVKFTVPFKNRLMLCGYTEGKEGNRVDYSVTNAPDVHNGEESSMGGIQSLYFGGIDDLTCAVSLYNRFGSNIVSSLLMLKNSEVSLLTGDGPDNYRIYPISLNIGCGAFLTLLTAEVGYTYADDINRNVAIWVSDSGPMLFDGAAIVPIPGFKKYFDPASSECINRSAIKRAVAFFDTTHKEYNFLFPSGSGIPNVTKWLVYDVVRKRSYEKVVGTSLMPQAVWPVIDTNGAQYTYAGIDSGHMMRLEHATSTANKWADDTNSNLVQVIETGDFFPSESQWDKTRLRRFKIVAKNIAENASLSMRHFADTAPTSGSGEPLTSMNIFASGNKGVTRATQNTNLIGWSHRFRFSTGISGEAKKGLQPLGYGIQFYKERDDE